MITIRTTLHVTVQSTYFWVILSVNMCQKQSGFLVIIWFSECFESMRMYRQCSDWFLRENDELIPQCTKCAVSLHVFPQSVCSSDLDSISQTHSLCVCCCIHSVHSHRIGTGPHSLCQFERCRWWKLWMFRGQSMLSQDISFCKLRWKLNHEFAWNLNWFSESDDLNHFDLKFMWFSQLKIARNLSSENWFSFSASIWRKYIFRTLRQHTICFIIFMLWIYCPFWRWHLIPCLGSDQSSADQRHSHYDSRRTERRSDWELQWWFWIQSVYFEADPIGQAHHRHVRR